MRILWPVLGCILVAYSSAAIALEARIRDSPRLERLSCRFLLLCADNKLLQNAYHQLWDGGVDGPRLAAESFREALSRDMAYSYRWCDLGEALLESGQTAEARYCFKRASELSPYLAPILLRAANFHFRIGETRDALFYTSRILRIILEYDPIIFSTYTRLGVSIDDVLHYGIPEDRRAAQAFLRYLMRTGPLEHVQRTWDWVVSHSFADNPLAGEYLEFLVKHRRYQTAGDAWASYVGARKGDYLQSNWLFNGDFEMEPTGTVFDWRARQSGGVQVARDPSVHYSGKWSLRIRFDGTENLAYNAVSQSAPLSPGVYQFEAFVRTEGMTADQGIGFRILDTETPPGLDVRTEKVVDAPDWKKLETTFDVQGQTRLIQIQVVRQPSLKFENKISGVAWIDAVRLMRIR